MLNGLQKRFGRFLGRNELLWRSVGTVFSTVASAASEKRYSMLAKMNHPKLRHITEVQDGPFRGMRLAGEDSSWGPMYPKVMGLYERELHDTIREILDSGIAYVVDVGCAEGYYAVGMAVADRNLRVLAFDIDPRARQCCLELSRKNGVEDRVRIGQACSSQTLLNLNLEGRSLMLIDCEGAEVELLTPQVAGHLRHCFFLVETHDSKCPGSLDKMVSVFGATHDVELIVNEPFKARKEVLGLLSGIESSSRLGLDLLSDRRNGATPWVIARPRS